MLVPFQIPCDPKGLSDLNRRLLATRWNDAVTGEQQKVGGMLCSEAPFL
jgi:hypothetical protein